jgi:hypothetical protein
VVLAELNERLARPPEFDLADSDQLGLFVVSRLAARHQIKVSLRGSPYGGTAAIVLMPHHLVTAAEDAVTPESQRPDQASQRPDQAGLYPGAVAGTNRTNGTPLARSGARLGLGAAATPATPGPDAGLPRRPRQASLAPQLREPGSPAGPPAGDGQPQARSADQARTLFSSIQQGWRNGRAAAGQPDGTPGDSPDGGPGSRTTPDEAGR